MARIKLEIPAATLATVEIPVRITDLNYGNHVGNDDFVSLIHEARVQWLRLQGSSELSVAGVSLIMSDLAVEFKQEAFYGDLIRISLHAGELSRAGFELYYRLTTERNGKELLLAQAKTGMVCFDYRQRRPLPLPEGLRQLLAAG